MEALKAAGVRRVILVGPNPEWREPLPRSLLKYAKADLLHRIPDRMNYNLDEVAIKSDREFSNWISGTGAIYLSPMSFLCNEEGCLARVQENGHTDLSAYDAHHLTTVGSQYLAGRIFPTFFETLPARVNP